MLLYQAQHSTMFYRLALPLFEALGGVQNLRWSVAGMRLMNVGLIATAVWVSLEVLRRVVRRKRDAALIGMAMTAHPLFLMNGARVANDALGVFLATLAIASSLALVSRTDDRRLALHGATTGCLIGLAIMAKATNFAYDTLRGDLLADHADPAQARRGCARRSQPWPLVLAFLW